MPRRTPVHLEGWLRQGWTYSERHRLRGAVGACVLTVIAAAIVFARRPDQFLHPYIWVEEGVYTLRFYAESGWDTLFEPLAGYLLTASKLIDLTAFQLSILWAPEIAAGLGIGLACAVVVAIALSPTHLRWPYACALAPLLVPSTPEVFATGSYAFWWAGLLLPLTVLWTDEKQWLRWIFLLVGGLSSPLIGAIVVLLAVRFVLERNRREMIALLVAAAASLAQIVGMLAQTKYGVFALNTWPAPGALPVLVQKFVGAFFHSDTKRAGFAIAAALAVLAWWARRRLDRYFVLLVLSFGAVSLLVTFRLPAKELAGINPFGAGPRYFFYSFTLLTWILIWLAAVSPRAVQAVLAAGFGSTLVLAGTRLSIRHDPFDWKREVLACAQAERYELPIHYAGSKNEMWHLELTGAQCRQLLARSLF